MRVATSVGARAYRGKALVREHVFVALQGKRLGIGQRAAVMHSRSLHPHMHAHAPTHARSSACKDQPAQHTHARTHARTHAHLLHKLVCAADELEMVDVVKLGRDF